MTFETKNSFNLGLVARKSVCFANNKGADQPAHPRSLISAFVIRLLEGIISQLATSEVLRFYVVPVAQ